MKSKVQGHSCVLTRAPWTVRKTKMDGLRKRKVQRVVSYDSKWSSRELSGASGRPFTTDRPLYSWFLKTFPIPELKNREITKPVFSTRMYGCNCISQITFTSKYFIQIFLLRNFFGVKKILNWFCVNFILSLGFKFFIKNFESVGSYPPRYR